MSDVLGMYAYYAVDHKRSGAVDARGGGDILAAEATAT